MTTSTNNPGAVVVLGMHRAGTSLVASMLQAMGVHIGDDLLGPAESNPRGHFEDLDFVRLNDRILAACGHHWADPPQPHGVLLAGRVMQAEIARLVARKQGNHAGLPPRLWGWKDPRTAITAPLYHPHLHNPRYIWVRRDRDAVARSLWHRSVQQDREVLPGQWQAVAAAYEHRIERFLAAVECPVYEVHYEELTEKGSAAWIAQEMAAWLGIDDPGAAQAALERVEYRETARGFGRLGVGVPYYKATYHFWRWWSWLLVGGLENGDRLLNDWDVPGELPIPLAHNALVRAFLESDADTMLMIEDDHVANQDVVRNIRYKEENWFYDIVCASYTNRRMPPTAVGVNFSGDVNEYGEYECVVKPLDVSLTGTQEYDVAALGLVLVRRWVLEAMLGDNDPAEYFWMDWRGRNSQDIQFYAGARAVGARVGVDRDNPIGHVGQKIYNMMDFYRAQERLEQTAKEKMEVNHG